MAMYYHDGDELAYYGIYAEESGSEESEIQDRERNKVINETRAVTKQTKNEGVTGPMQMRPGNSSVNGNGKKKRKKRKKKKKGAVITKSPDMTGRHGESEYDSDVSVHVAVDYAGKTVAPLKLDDWRRIGAEARDIENPEWRNICWTRYNMEERRIQRDPWWEDTRKPRKSYRFGYQVWIPRFDGGGPERVFCPENKCRYSRLMEDARDADEALSYHYEEKHGMDCVEVDEMKDGRVIFLDRDFTGFMPCYIESCDYGISGYENFDIGGKDIQYHLQRTHKINDGLEVVGCCRCREIYELWLFSEHRCDLVIEMKMRREECVRMWTEWGDELRDGYLRDKRRRDGDPHWMNLDVHRRSYRINDIVWFSPNIWNLITCPEKGCQFIDEFGEMDDHYEEIHGMPDIAIESTCKEEFLIMDRSDLEWPCPVRDCNWGTWKINREENYGQLFMNHYREAHKKSWDDVYVIWKCCKQIEDWDFITTHECELGPGVLPLNENNRSKKEPGKIAKMSDNLDIDQTEESDHQKISNQPREIIRREIIDIESPNGEMVGVRPRDKQKVEIHENRHLEVLNYMEKTKGISKVTEVESRPGDGTEEMVEMEVSTGGRIAGGYGCSAGPDEREEMKSGTESYLDGETEKLVDDPSIYNEKGIENREKISIEKIVSKIQEWEIHVNRHLGVLNYEGKTKGIPGVAELESKPEIKVRRDRTEELMEVETSPNGRGTSGRSGCSEYIEILEEMRSGSESYLNSETEKLVVNPNEYNKKEIENQEITSVENLDLETNKSGCERNKNLVNENGSPGTDREVVAFFGVCHEGEAEVALREGEERHIYLSSVEGEKIPCPESGCKRRFDEGQYEKSIDSMIVHLAMAHDVQCTRVIVICKLCREATEGNEFRTHRCRLITSGPLSIDPRRLSTEKRFTIELASILDLLEKADTDMEINRIRERAEELFVKEFKKPRSDSPRGEDITMRTSGFEFLEVEGFGDKANWEGTIEDSDRPVRKGIDIFISTPMKRRIRCTEGQCEFVCEKFEFGDERNELINHLWNDHKIDIYRIYGINSENIHEPLVETGKRVKWAETDENDYKGDVTEIEIDWDPLGRSNKLDETLPDEKTIVDGGGSDIAYDSEEESARLKYLDMMNEGCEMERRIEDIHSPTPVEPEYLIVENAESEGGLGVIDTESTETLKPRFTKKLREKKRKKKMLRDEENKRVFQMENGKQFNNNNKDIETQKIEQTQNKRTRNNREENDAGVNKSNGREDNTEVNKRNSYDKDENRAWKTEYNDVNQTIEKQRKDGVQVDKENININKIENNAWNTEQHQTIQRLGFGNDGKALGGINSYGNREEKGNSKIQLVGHDGGGERPEEKLEVIQLENGKQYNIMNKNNIETQNIERAQSERNGKYNINNYERKMNPYNYRNKSEEWNINQAGINNKRIENNHNKSQIEKRSPYNKYKKQEGTWNSEHKINQTKSEGTNWRKVETFYRTRVFYRSNSNEPDNYIEISEEQTENQIEWGSARKTMDRELKNGEESEGGNRAIFNRTDIRPFTEFGNKKDEKRTVIPDKNTNKQKSGEYIFLKSSPVDSQSPEMTPCTLEFSRTDINDYRCEKPVDSEDDDEWRLQEKEGTADLNAERALETDDWRMNDSPREDNLDEMETSRSCACQTVNTREQFEMDNATERVKTEYWNSNAEHFRIEAEKQHKELGTLQSEQLMSRGLSTALNKVSHLEGLAARPNEPATCNLISQILIAIAQHLNVKGFKQ